MVRLGHTVRLIPPQYVKSYVKRNKIDAADAEAICEAVGRPNMRFVPIKTREQQGILALHRVKALLVRQRTAAVNAARGLLGEFGGVIGKGIRKVDELRSRMRRLDPEVFPDEARLDDGRVEMDTNVVERAIRPHTLTRKNALFAGSDGGARHWVIAMTLIQTAKPNGRVPDGGVGAVGK